MKNKLFVLFPFLLVSLSACNSNGKDAKVKLSYGSRYDKGAIALTLNEFKTRIDNEESFLLALSPGNEDEVTCSCWRTFSSLVDEYVLNHDQIVYKIDVYKVESYGLKAPVNQDPGFAIFENGQLKKQYFYKTKDTPTYFLNKDAFASFVKTISIAPSMVYINDEQYLAMKDGRNDFSMSIVRKGCSDCSYVLPNVFDPFFKKNTAKQLLYLLDIEDLDHYHRSTEEEEKTYQAYKDSLLLSEKHNSAYGYGTGVVPTTFIYRGGQIIDGNIFFNDEVGQKEDGTYYISKSYFSESRVTNLKYTTTILEGKELREDEIANYKGYIYLPSSSASVYHTPIIEDFLNYYFK
ncbi:MAG: hypothetical protein IJQ67_03530 [Bacilli bacterium]|nr:hypothetical protein [Bacilli bacterium]